MKLVGLMPARNEDWVIGLTARAALLWMDELIVLNHASTDHTAYLLDAVIKETGRVTILEESDPVWREMQHRQRLLEVGRQHGGTHFALVDADEILSGDLLATIRETIERGLPGEVLTLPWRSLWRSLDFFRIDGAWRDAHASIAFRDAPQLHWETREGYDHHHRHPMGSYFTDPKFTPSHGTLGMGHFLVSNGGLLHMQFVCWRRLLAKQALYKMIEVIRWPGRESVEKTNQRYNRTVEEHGLAIQSVPYNCWEPYQKWLPFVNISKDLVPWQERECERLWVEYGPQKFVGLDLFGVVC